MNLNLIVLVGFACLYLACMVVAPDVPDGTSERYIVIGNMIQGNNDSELELKVIAAGKGIVTVKDGKRSHGDWAANGTIQFTGNFIQKGDPLKPDAVVGKVVISDGSNIVYFSAAEATPSGPFATLDNFNDNWIQATSASRDPVNPHTVVFAMMMEFFEGFKPVQNVYMPASPRANQLPNEVQIGGRRKLARYASGLLIGNHFPK